MRGLDKVHIKGLFPRLREFEAREHIFKVLPYVSLGALSRTELQLLNQLHCRRKRRHRTIFTDEQLEALENLFQETKYPDVGTREQLARRVHLREEKVE
eukprot:g42682.t1